MGQIGKSSKPCQNMPQASGKRGCLQQCWRKFQLVQVLWRRDTVSRNTAHTVYPSAQQSHFLESTLKIHFQQNETKYAQGY